MKHKKKWFSTLLGALLAVVLAFPVFAATPPYTITIENSQDGHTYEAYQVFAGDLSNNVLSNVTWGTGVNGANLLSALQSDNTIGSYFTTCSTAADVAKILSDNSAGAFASNSDNLDAFAALVGQNLTTTYASSSDAGSTYTISNLTAGYYFVKDRNDSLDATVHPDAYTKFMLQLVKDISVSPKSDLPTVEKKVQEGSMSSDDGYGTGYNDVADWNISDKVPFKLIGTVPKMNGYSTYEYTFHDTLSTGLTLDSTSVQVYLAGSKNADLSGLTPLAANTDYTLTLPSDSGTALSDGCSFEIAFSDLTSVNGIDPDQTQYIIVTYDATLNDSAEIGLDGNPNTVQLEFSNNPAVSTDTDKTTEDTVIVFTYELDGTKVDGVDTNTKLQGAEFVLLNSDATQVAQIGEDGKLNGWTNLPTGTGNAITYEDWQNMDPTVILTSGSDGLFRAIGLDDGTYQLREIKAPAGYNLLPGDVEIVISAATANNQSWGGVASIALTGLEVTAQEGSEPSVNSSGDIDTGVAPVTIANNKGATLPSTGGMGTTLFYIVGGVLAVSAGVVLVARRRTSSDR